MNEEERQHQISFTEKLVSESVGKLKQFWGEKYLVTVTVNIHKINEPTIDMTKIYS